jgi:hypothetical protein
MPIDGLFGTYVYVFHLCGLVRWYVVKTLELATVSLPIATQKHLAPK